ncbi:MAG: hypothetical protein IJF92_06035 [Bacilli bacterium]|nr:hypothetical protein [Bacilli bacterium]
MNDLVEFLTSTEIMVVYIVVGIACLLCFIIYLLDRSYYKRKRRHNTKELNKLVEKVQEEISEEDTKVEVVNNEVVLETTIEEKPEIIVEENNIETLEYTNVEPDKTEAQEELQKLTEVLEKAQEEENKTIDLTEFEEEQEKNAIISIDELMSKTQTLYEKGELDKYEDESSKPISLQDLEKAKQQVEEEPVLIKLDDFESVTTSVSTVEEAPKFKSSPVISPVFGIESNLGTTANDMELENTANYEKLDEELKKTNEFLTTLKELQKNLD